MGVVDDDFAFLPFQTVIGHVVVPGNILLVNELALLALGPNGTLRLVYADDVHVVGELRALFAKNHPVGLHEHPSGLLGVGSLFLLGRQSQ